MIELNILELFAGIEGFYSFTYLALDVQKVNLSGLILTWLGGL